MYLCYQYTVHVHVPVKAHVRINIYTLTKNIEHLFYIVPIYLI